MAITGHVKSPYFLAGSTSWTEWDLSSPARHLTLTLTHVPWVKVRSLNTELPGKSSKVPILRAIFRRALRKKRQGQVCTWKFPLIASWIMIVVRSQDPKWWQWQRKWEWKLCLTLCDPMDYCTPGSSVHGVLQAKMLEWVAFPFSRGSFWPSDWTRIAGRSLPSEPPGQRWWGNGKSHKAEHGDVGLALEGSLLSKAWPFKTEGSRNIPLYQRVIGFWRNHGVVNESRGRRRGLSGCPHHFTFHLCSHERDTLLTSCVLIYGVGSW